MSQSDSAKSINESGSCLIHITTFEFFTFSPSEYHLESTFRGNDVNWVSILHLVKYRFQVNLQRTSQNPNSNLNQSGDGEVEPTLTEERRKIYQPQMNSCSTEA